MLNNNRANKLACKKLLEGFIVVLSCPEGQNLVRYGLSRETHDKLQSPNPKAHTNDSKEHPNSKDEYMYIILLFLSSFFFSFSNANVGSWQPF
jgi:hypothetical protein